MKFILDKKLVVIINGKGGIGKGTLCNFVATYYGVRNISSIAPIKDIAAKYGYTGIKDEKERKFLAALKQAFSDFNDLPFSFIAEETRKFALNSHEDILFVHIREPEAIGRFKTYVKVTLGMNCVTMLVSAPSREQAVYGNSADDGVENYRYDAVFEGDESLGDGYEARFMDFFYDTMKPLNIRVLNTPRGFTSTPWRDPESRRRWDALEGSIEGGSTLKHTGIVRRVDDLGRIVITKRVRQQLGIKADDPMEIMIDSEGRVVLEKYNPDRFDA